MAVSTIGSGKDYANIKAWEADLPATLLEDETAEIYGTITISAASDTFLNVTTAADKRLIFKAASGQEWYDNPATIATLDLDAGGSWGYLNLDDDCAHLSMQGIRWQLFNSGGALRYNSGSTDPGDSLCEFIDCHFEPPAGGVTSPIVYAGGGFWRKTTYSNCVGGFYWKADNGGADTAVNCTAYFDLTDGTHSNATFRYFLTATRCASFEHGPSGWKDFLNIGTLTDCVSQDTSGDLATGKLLSNQYTDPANNDWSYKTGNDLEGAATGGANVGFDLGAVQTAGGGGPTGKRWGGVPHTMGSGPALTNMGRW